MLRQKTTPFIEYNYWLKCLLIVNIFSWVLQFGYLVQYLFSWVLYITQPDQYTAIFCLPGHNTCVPGLCIFTIGHKYKLYVRKKLYPVLLAYILIKFYYRFLCGYTASTVIKPTNSNKLKLKHHTNLNIINLFVQLVSNLLLFLFRILLIIFSMIFSVRINHFNKKNLPFLKSEASL